MSDKRNHENELTFRLEEGRVIAQWSDGGMVISDSVEALLLYTISRRLAVAENGLEGQPEVGR